VKLELTSLGEVADFINGYAFSPLDRNEEGKRIIRIQNLTDSTKPYNRTKKNVGDKYEVYPKDLLVSWSASLGVFEWNEKDIALVNQHIFKVIPRDGVYKPYLRHAITVVLKSMDRFTHGSTMKHINRAEFLDTKIYLPSDIDEQKRIANILDKADAIRQKRQQTIELADQFLRSAFLDMFGDPVKNPKGWNKRLLDEIIQVQSGQVDPKVSPYCNLPHVGGDNIISGSGKLLNVKLAKELNLKSGKYAFDESFILYSKIRPILNKVASPNFSGICSADIYPIRPKAKTVSKYFLEAVLKSKDFLKYCEKVSTRTNIPKINRSDLLSYSAPIPTYIEGSQQSQFEDLAKNISIIKEKLFQSYEHSISLFNSLTQRAFRGEL
tara:strand:- start:1005 stop:2147 length:1143 start_codon:yes stop_codon:yes gene_type:complete